MESRDDLIGRKLCGYRGELGRNIVGKKLFEGDQMVKALHTLGGIAKQRRNERAAYLDAVAVNLCGNAEAVCRSIEKRFGLG